MNEKNEKLVILLVDNLGDLSDIQVSNHEIYFKFRGFAFSIAQRIDEDYYALFAYPKWQGEIDSLIKQLERGANFKDSVFVKISDSETTTNIYKIYSALENQTLGIDELFNNLGIQ